MKSHCLLLILCISPFFHTRNVATARPDCLETVTTTEVLAPTETTALSEILASSAETVSSSVATSVPSLSGTHVTSRHTIRDTTTASTPTTSETHSNPNATHTAEVPSGSGGVYGIPGTVASFVMALGVAFAYALM